MEKAENMEKYLRVGVITSSHGVRGEVNVFPTTDDMKRFKKLKTCILDTGKGYRELHLESVRFFKQMVIVKFTEFNSADDTLPYKNRDLLITRDQAVKLGKDEYFICDLIGLKVITDEGGYFGEVTDVMQTGANDVYIVRRPDKTEVLLPAIKDCILDIDIDEGRITAYIMPGLVD